MVKTIRLKSQNYRNWNHKLILKFMLLVKFHIPYLLFWMLGIIKKNEFQKKKNKRNLKYILHFLPVVMIADLMAAGLQEG